MTFLSHCNLEKFLLVDKAMIHCSGRSKFKVDMPLQPIRYCFKVYIITEASTCLFLIGKCMEKCCYLKKYLVRLFIDTKIKVSIYLRLFLCNYKYWILDITWVLSLYNCNEWFKIHELSFYAISGRKNMLNLWRDSKLIILLSNYGNNLKGCI